MRNFTILFVLILFCLPAQAQTISCSDFKVGSYVNTENGKVKTRIIRNKKFQLEENGGVKIKLKIEWIDECTYKLIFVEGNEAWWKMVGKDHTSPDLIVKIVSTDKDSYVQESQFEGEEFIYKSVMVKVE